MEKRTDQKKSLHGRRHGGTGNVRIILTYMLDLFCLRIVAISVDRLFEIEATLPTV